MAFACGVLAADRQVIARGVEVIGGTMTPFAATRWAFSSAPDERARVAVNTWILGGGEFDGTVDFDAAVRDPSSPKALRADFDSGDHLHPNDAGYRAMGDSVPLALFR